jgi:hypothetical protein
MEFFAMTGYSVDFAIQGSKGHHVVTRRGKSVSVYQVGPSVSRVFAQIWALLSFAFYRGLCTIWTVTLLSQEDSRLPPAVLFLRTAKERTNGSLSHPSLVALSVL